MGVLCLSTVPEAAPVYDDVYTDSSSIVVNWRKPDILSYLISLGQVVSIWTPGRIEQEKYMQCKCHTYWQLYFFDFDIFVS